MPKDKHNPVDAKFLSDVYAVPLKPENYDELIEGWDQLLSSVVPKGNPNEQTSTDLSPLEAHFNRSYDALLKIGRRPTPIDLIHLDPKPCLGVSASGVVTEVNRYANKLFAIEPGDNVAEFIDADQKAALDILLSEALGKSSSQSALVLHSNLAIRSLNHKVPTSFSLVALSSHADNQKTVAKLVSNDLSWNHAIGDWMKLSFELSDAESDVLRILVSGRSLQSLAEEKGRSIETIRSQLKSLLRKTGMSSQIELVRLFSGFELVPPELRALTADKPTYRSYSYPVKMPDGRVIQVDEFGAVDRRPVLFLHGMMDGTEPTQEAISLLKEKNIRMICPWRPGFAGSTAHDCDVDSAAFSYADDIKEVIGWLGLPPCILVGNMAGAVYAFAAATRCPELFTGIVNVSGTVPITSDEQIRMMSSRQRIIAFTAKYTPKLVKFILRAAVAQVDAGGADTLVQAIYQASPRDKAVTENSSEIRGLLFDGYRASMAQGQTGFLADGFQVLGDWSHYVEPVEVPVHLIHGDDDPTVKMSNVRSFTRQFPQFEITELPATGQLVFYSQPRIVVETIEKLL